jgi:CO/xanthine dehydrogenase Mo-binding subunit
MCSPSGGVYDSGDCQASLNLLLAKADYEQLLREQQTARAQGRLVGIGVVSSIEPGLTGPPMLALASPRIFTRTSSPEGILVRIDGFGKFIAELGFPPGGQSQHSFVRQILADYFAVELEDIQVITVDSLSMQPSTGPISSSMAIALSGAVLGVAARLTDKLKRAAVMLRPARMTSSCSTAVSCARAGKSLAVASGAVHDGASRLAPGGRRRQPAGDLRVEPAGSHDSR